ncbi:MAG TPA: hypothetical protein DIT64_18835 [Verrucomicrobiales bacterium]|nr:hypothetical protein [Verrucomicrobiales bacterium]
MKPKSKKKAANKKTAPRRAIQKRGALKKKTTTAAAKKLTSPAPKPKPAVKAPTPVIKGGIREYFVVRAAKTPAALLSPLTSNGKPRISLNEGEIWIEDSDGVTTPETLPYELESGDTICTYNPGDDPSDPATLPEIQSFEVDCYESDGSYYEDVIVYDYFDDCISVDLTVLDECIEEPEPATDENPYTCNDGTFSIGIEG